MAHADVPSERGGLESRIVERALSDADFRARLIAAPRAAVSEELELELPEGLKIEVVEERPDRLVIVLPVDLNGIGYDAAWAMTGVRPVGTAPARKQG